MHKQSLLEEGECTHASRSHLTVCSVGVQLCSATKLSSVIRLCTWSLSITVVVHAGGQVVCPLCY